MIVQGVQDLIVRLEPGTRLHAITQSMAGQIIAMDYLAVVDPHTAAHLREQSGAFAPNYVEFVEVPA